MGNIQIKRGLNANFGGVTLVQGEPAFTTDTQKLYVGDGTSKVLINPDNVPSATKLQSARTISITGDGSGSTLFDGTGDASITILLANSGAVAGTYTKLTIDAKGRVTGATNLSASDIPSITLSKISDVGTVASKNYGNGAGQVPLLNGSGKLDDTVIPTLAVNDVFEVATESAMLALTAQRGDIAIRSDLNKSFVLKNETPTVLANWAELKTPTDTVLSVNSRTGAITLTATDVGLGNVTNESKATMFANSALTGIPTAPTPAVGTNTTQVATTAYVKSQGYATLASPTFTGSPISPTPATADNSTLIATTAFVKAQSYLKTTDNIDGGTF